MANMNECEDFMVTKRSGNYRQYTLQNIPNKIKKEFSVVYNSHTNVTTPEISKDWFHRLGESVHAVSDHAGLQNSEDSSSDNWIDQPTRSTDNSFEEMVEFLPMDNDNDEQVKHRDCQNHEVSILMADWSAIINQCGAVHKVCTGPGTIFLN